MKNNKCNVTQCCNDTHQGAPHAGKQMYAYVSYLDDGQSCYLYSHCMIRVLCCYFSSIYWSVACVCALHCLWLSGETVRPLDHCVTDDMPFKKKKELQQKANASR